jgi:hypothetical protein
MFAVLAEDRSVAEVLVVLVKPIRGRPNIGVPKKGFSGLREIMLQSRKPYY